MIIKCVIQLVEYKHYGIYCINQIIDIAKNIREAIISNNEIDECLSLHCLFQMKYGVILPMLLTMFFLYEKHSLSF